MAWLSIGLVASRLIAVDSGVVTGLSETVGDFLIGGSLAVGVGLVWGGLEVEAALEELCSSLIDGAGGNRGAGRGPNMELEYIEDIMEDSDIGGADVNIAAGSGRGGVGVDGKGDPIRGIGGILSRCSGTG